MLLFVCFSLYLFIIIGSYFQPTPNPRLDAPSQCENHPIFFAITYQTSVGRKHLAAAQLFPARAVAHL